jgi:TonB family protein
MTSLSLRDLSPLSLAGCVAVLAVGLVAFAGLLGLRLQRRGASRFWASPAALALCLLPLAVGTAFAGLGFRQVLDGMALVGSGGVAAIAAGSAEALLAVLVGLGTVLILTACAFLMTAVGSSRSSVPPSGGLAGWGLLSIALAALALLTGIVALVLWMAAGLNGLSLDPRTLPPRLSLVLVGAFALVVVTLVLALAGAVVAPRGPADLGMKLASLATFALCGLMAAAGLWATWTRSEELLATALTGAPPGELPEPVTTPVVESAEPPRPPPPPPPASVAPAGRAYRVGGEIREPKRIKNVTPVYPEIAKQARVQGVVILEATISPRGDVTSVRVLRGIPLLDQAAIDAVKQWVYSPTLLNGVPVPVIMTVTVNYKLS